MRYALGRVTILANKAVQYQQRGTTDHAYIRHVKCWPMPVRQVEIEKIGHGPVIDSIKRIAKRPADDQRQTSNSKSVARPQQPSNECRRNGRRKECESPRWQFMTTQHSKADALYPSSPARKYLLERSTARAPLKFKRPRPHKTRRSLASSGWSGQPRVGEPPVNNGSSGLLEFIRLRSWCSHWRYS